MIPVRRRVVFDCNVFLQAASRERGPAAQCLKACEAGHLALFVSKPVLAELRAVLQDADVRAKLPSLSDEVVDAFLGRVKFRATLVRGVRARFDLPRDPDDAKYVDLCLAIDGDLIVTRDRDLLDLMTGYDDSAKQFRQILPRARIVAPAELLDALRAESIAIDTPS